MSTKEIRVDELADVSRQWSPTEKNIDENFRENWRNWDPLKPAAGDNAAVVRGFINAWNTGDFDTISGLTASDTVHHTRYSDFRLEGLRLVHNLLNTLLPDFQVQVEEVREEGQLVVAHVAVSGTHTGGLLDIAPSHKEVSFTATEVFRVVDGTVAEHWWGVYNGLSALVDEDGLNPVIGLIFAC